MKIIDESVNNLWDLLGLLILIIPWLMGLVLAKAGWSTVFALFPPYAWYLVIERVMQSLGWN